MRSNPGYLLKSFLLYLCKTDLMTTIIGPDLATLGKRLNNGFNLGHLATGGLLNNSVVKVAASTSSLLTNSSHVFLRILKLRNFFAKFYVSFFRRLQSVFSVMINSYIGMFDLNRKLLLCRKTKQRKFREKNSKIRRSGIVKTCDELDLCLG